MGERREKWRLHNRLEERTCPFHIEDNGTFFADLTPPLQCEAEEARVLEARLLHGITAYELIDDDRIIPDRFVVDWVTPMTATCDELAITRGYATNKPIQDIDADWGKLKKRTISVVRVATERKASLAEEVLVQTCPPEIIWSRKPVPLKLCGETFDPGELRSHLQETLELGRDHFVEFVYRDTNPPTGAMTDRVAATCAMIRDLSGHPEGSRH